MTEIPLTGPSGDNPLGFLTALGTLRVLFDLGHDIALHWTPDRQSVLTLNARWNNGRIVDEVYRAVARQSGAGQDHTKASIEAWDVAKRVVAKKRADLKRRRLRGNEAKEVRRAELGPLIDAANQKRQAYLVCLSRSAPDSCVTLGKNLTASNDEFVSHCQDSLNDATPRQHRWPDLCAAFGSADPNQPANRMSATPFALVSGSGHQDFLGSVQALMVEVRREHLEKALFGPWVPSDDKYSLRLDSVDDRRYAMMDRDPTASGNKPRTLWGANRLAFEALAFYPCVPAGRASLTAGWRMKSRDEGTWRWPLWTSPLSANTVRVLLTHPDIWRDEPEARQRLRAIGCVTVLSSQRIRVGSGQNVKFNLTPGVPVW